MSKNYWVSDPVILLLFYFGLFVCFVLFFFFSGFFFSGEMPSASDATNAYRVEQAQPNRNPSDVIKIKIHCLGGGSGIIGSLLFIIPFNFFRVIHYSLFNFAQYSLFIFKFVE